MRVAIERWLKNTLHFLLIVSLTAIAIVSLFLLGIRPVFYLTFLTGKLTGVGSLFWFNPAFWLHPPLEYFEVWQEDENRQSEQFQMIAILQRSPILGSNEFIVRRLDGRDRFLQSCEATSVDYTANLQDALIYSDYLSAWDAAIHCYVLCDREFTFTVESIGQTVDVELKTLNN